MVEKIKTMPVQDTKRMVIKPMPGNKWKLRAFIVSFCILVIWFETLGDSWISTEQRPERESWRYQLEMVIGGL